MFSGGKLRHSTERNSKSEKCKSRKTNKQSRSKSKKQERQEHKTKAKEEQKIAINTPTRQKDREQEAKSKRQKQCKNLRSASKEAKSKEQETAEPNPPLDKPFYNKLWFPSLDSVTMHQVPLLEDGICVDIGMLSSITPSRQIPVSLRRRLGQTRCGIHGAYESD